jgi:hypothetical protein
MVLKIVNSEQLNNFLVKKPVQWSHLVSVRALLRALPLALNGIDRQRWLPNFRTYFICWAAGRIPKRDFSVNVEHVSYLAVDPSAMYAARVVTASSASDATNFAARVVDFVASALVKSAPSHQKYDVLSIFWKSVEDDIIFLSSDKSIDLFAELALLSLWRQDVPDFIEDHWQGIAWDDALVLDYSMWINWYQALLTGDGPSADYFGSDLTLRIAQQPDVWWDRPAAEVNADIAAWLKEKKESSVDVPSPEPGLSATIDSSGRVGFAHSGQASDEELASTVGLRQVLLGAAEDLAALLVGNNSVAISPSIVPRYLACLRDEHLSVDTLFALGVRLSNARAAIQRQIDSKDFPDLAPDIAEALGSVLELHGPLILSTAEGRKLVDASSSFLRTEADNAKLKRVARDYGLAVKNSPDLFNEGTRELLPELNEDVASGPHPERSTQVAMSANRNILIPIAKVVLQEGILDSRVGSDLVGVTALTVDASFAFLIDHMAVIRELASVSGAYLQWIEVLLYRLERGFRRRA